LTRLAYAAHVLDQRAVTIALILVNGVLTVLLVPLAVLGISFGVSAASYGASQSLPSVVIGASGLLGLGGAWLRIFLHSARLRSMRFIRCAIAVALVLGIAAAALLVLWGALAGPRWPVLSLYIVAAAVGLWCLAATICLDDDVA
jgi:hypothetical protein